MAHAEVLDIDIDVAHEADVAEVIALVDPRRRFIGRIIGGKYRIERRIAEGGMGRVFAATHLELERPVALKVIRQDLASDGSLVERFVNEARAAAMLRGQNVAQVLDAGCTDDGLPYFVMEYLDGETMADIVDRDSALPVETAIDYALQICAGLSEAHAVGIVHRDVKPQNLVVSRKPDGSPLVKILDFGIAKLLYTRDSKTMTQATQSMGSPSYMSPEQMRSPHDVDHRTDIWALGAVLYEMLTGKPAFDGATVPEVCANVLAGSPLPIGATTSGVPRELEAIVMRCLQKERDDRFMTASQIAEALECVAVGRDSTAPESRSRSRHPADRRANRWAVDKSGRARKPSRTRTVVGWVAAVSAAAVAGFMFMAPTVRASVGDWILGPVLDSEIGRIADRIYEPPEVVPIRSSTVGSVGEVQSKGESTHIQAAATK